MTDEVKTITADEVEAEPAPMDIDADPSNWKLAEQMAYREKTGVNPQYAMLKIGKAFETEDAEQYSNIPPEWLLGLAWITERRKDKFLKFDEMAEKLEYGALLRAIIAWATTKAESDPPPAPKRTARKKS